MCIISGPVLSVNSTKILALPSKNGNRQLTVYRNAVTTPDSNTMCLPVPNPNTVKFENVPKDIFKQCSKSFDIRLSRGFSDGIVAGAVLSTNSARRALPIQSHGSYEVVLVPSMDDLDLIPTHFTVLSSEVVEFLKASYPINFGVLLCKLKKGSTDYEPFAYSHNIQANDQLFFPTKHYHVHDKPNQWSAHDEEPGWTGAFGGSLLGGDLMGLPGRKMPQIVNTRFANDWDHEIYSAQTPTWCHESSKKVMKGRNEISWSDMPSDFSFGPSLVMRCKEMVGHSANIDIEMPIYVN
jgi:hypothetical protein